MSNYSFIPAFFHKACSPNHHVILHCQILWFLISSYTLFDIRSCIPLFSIHLFAPSPAITPHSWALFLLVERVVSCFQEPSLMDTMKGILTWKTAELVLILSGSLSHWGALDTVLTPSMPPLTHFQIKEMIQGDPISFYTLLVQVHKKIIEKQKSWLSASGKK